MKKTFIPFSRRLKKCTYLRNNDLDATIVCVSYGQCGHDRNNYLILFIKLIWL